MAEADTTPTPAPAQHSKLATTSDVSARLQQVLALLFPSNLAAKAALFAVVVALLPLLPSSQAPRIWDLPHLLLLGIIISYGVFGQKNADGAEVVAAKADEPSVEAYVSEMMQGSFAFEQNDDHDRDGDDGGVQAWSSQYLPPEDPLVVVAGGGNNGDSKGEKPLHLPVRKLKPAPADEVPATTLAGDVISGDDIEEEEEESRGDEFVGPKAGYDDVVRDRAIPSPSSVLDADLTLSSPSSPPLLPPPPPRPFLGSGLHKAKARSFNEFGVHDRSGFLLQSAGNDRQQFRSRSAVRAPTRRRRRNAFAGYDDPAASLGYGAADGDGDGDGDGDDVELDEMGAAGDASEDSSFSSDDDMLTDNNDEEENSYGEEEEDEEDGDSCDEELFELATRPGPGADELEEVGDEVDRKAEEFIAKFRDQIRMQRVVDPARR
ncbi:hypothetical protein QOZ80_4AG0308420 [Eleusine coracana subsp. coracana]|nr:hypothetical protein QOZ80_4AG0308420 [Eleusine coracana subsp. coracana]